MEAPVGYPTFIDITLVSAPMYVFLLETDEFKLPEKNEFIEKLFKDVPRDAKAIVINALQKKKTSALEDFLKKKFTNVKMATIAISANNEKPEGEQEDKQKSVGTLNSRVLEASDRVPVRRQAPSFTNETQEDTIIKRRSPVFTNFNADSTFDKRRPPVFTNDGTENTFDKRRPPVFTDGNTENIVVQRRVPSNENDIPTRTFSRRQPLADTPENPATSSSQEEAPIRKNINILSMAEIPTREENASIPQNPNENPISSAKREFEERDEDEEEDYDEDEDED